FKLVPCVVVFRCVLIQSAAEELTDRWYLYQKLRRRYKAPWIAIVVNSLVFTAMHLFNPGISFLALVQIFIVGMVFSLFVYYYNGLWMAMAFHAAWNFTQSIFFGLPNSGIVSAYSVFRLDAASATNGIFYNVNFGVEGSIGAVVILAGVCLFLALKNRGKGEHTDIWEQKGEVSDGEEDTVTQVM
ncbi:MAG: CPBP family intramembrane metalloprotease, partial [Firmicutes bacterium]|nr:CPBP family intramembrane metalloprotease [Bacillota bacterium]